MEDISTNDFPMIYRDDYCLFNSPKLFLKGGSERALPSFLVSLYGLTLDKPVTSMGVGKGGSSLLVGV